MFQFLVQSTPINHFLSEILEFLFSQQIFQVGKFKDGDFKYENIYSNSDSKILKSCILGPNSKDFYFCTQYSNKANSRNAILLPSNMVISYSGFSPKLSKSDISLTNWTKSFKNSSQKIVRVGIFGPKVKEFYFRIKLCNNTNSRRLISNIKLFFSNSSPKMPKWDIVLLYFRHFDFFTKMWNSRLLVLIMTIFFSNSEMKMLVSSILDLIFKDFNFCTKLCNKTNSRMKYDDSSFQIQVSKNPKGAFLVKNTKIRHFFPQNFAIQSGLEKFKWVNFKFSSKIPK